MACQWQLPRKATAVQTDVEILIMKTLQKSQDENLTSIDSNTTVVSRNNVWAHQCPLPLGKRTPWLTQCLLTACCKIAEHPKQVPDIYYKHQLNYGKSGGTYMSSLWRTSQSKVRLSLLLPHRASLPWIWMEMQKFSQKNKQTKKAVECLQLNGKLFYSSNYLKNITISCICLLDILFHPW